jgi:hypothetical protein
MVHSNFPMWYVVSLDENWSIDTTADVIQYENRTDILIDYPCIHGNRKIKTKQSGSFCR